jgi:NADH:ubiquinone oxidoreductase subunit C/predicted flap endonuclease-1-like 5' DNA nuclease
VTAPATLKLEDIKLEDIKLEDIAGLRVQRLGSETVYHLEDTLAYRTLCERLKNGGYDFPQCLSGVDMGYGLRSVLHLRRLKDHAEITVTVDVPYDNPHLPSVTDLWGGVEWHEREAFDLLGICYDAHPDLRRILLEDDWTIHPLQRRYDTGGYLIPSWQAQPWPDPEAGEAAKGEAGAKGKRPQTAKSQTAKEDKPPPKPVSAAKPPPAAEDDLTRIKGLSPEDEAKLKERGIKTLARIAKLNDKAAEKYAAELGFGTRVVAERWCEQAAALIKKEPS